ncbi:DUF1697 domain-containing protein [Euzebyella marina]|uniref:DUF1697 domain-containing protein n=1 Tax=Euzebyella marina TaxID=1761453 RepID=A0A3G2LAC5_9FLAO|nr:DUF1697 domain-containing protein [Euzebyella marina]AYN69200.1 DUF1697 domain-containing protein [Euzebyella marina]
MKKYIAFLRGVNVSGQKKLPMAQLREVLSKSGLSDVGTYIQSGNIFFSYQEVEKEEIEKLIRKTILTEFGFEVPVLVQLKTDIEDVVQNNPFLDSQDKARLYYVLLKEAPSEELKKAFEQEVFENENFHITNECVYLSCNAGYGKAKLNNNLIERKLKVEATTRNHKTMLKMNELAGEL